MASPRAECIFENSFVIQKQCSLFSAMQNRCLGAAQGEIYPICECCDGFKILAAGVSKPIHCSQCISLEGRSEQQGSLSATFLNRIMITYSNCSGFKTLWSQCHDRAELRLLSLHITLLRTDFLENHSIPYMSCNHTPHLLHLATQEDGFS